MAQPDFEVAAVLRDVDSGGLDAAGVVAGEPLYVERGRTLGVVAQTGGGDKRAGRVNVEFLADGVAVGGRCIVKEDARLRGHGRT